MPGPYRIEVVDHIHSWTGDGTFEVPGDDGSQEQEVDVELEER